MITRVHSFESSVQFPIRFQYNFNKIVRFRCVRETRCLLDVLCNDTVYLTLNR